MDSENYSDEIIQIQNPEQIVVNLTHIIENGQSEDFLQEQEENIQKCKQNIERICDKHYIDLIKNFQVYNQIKKQIKELSKQMQDIEKDQRIQKTSKMFDIQQLKKKKKTIENIQQLLQISKNCQKQIKLLKQAIENVKKENYLASIRNIQYLKQKQQSKNLNSQYFLNQISDIPQLINNLIHSEQDLLMSSWNQKIKLKQNEYGLLAIQNYDYIIQTLENIPIRNTINPEKMSFMQNIGKSSMLNGAGLKSKFSMIGGRISSLQGGFGGRISTLQNNNLARISMINKGKISTFGLGVNNNSKQKASVVNLNRNSVISGYQSLFQGLNVQQQIPGMERTSVLSQRQKGITNILNKKQKFLNEVFDFDLKIDISGLKQPFIVYEAMKEKTVCTQIFLKLRESQLMEIVEREKIENQQQLKQFAQNIIGFLIIEKQLFQQLTILNQSQNMNDVQLLAKQFRSVEKKIRGFFANIFDENEFIPAKNIVYLFAYLLEMLNFTSGSQSLILILQAQLQLFSDRMIYNIKKKLTDQIQKQSFEYHKVNNRQEYLAYTKIFNIYNDEIDDEEDNIDSYFDQQTMAYRASTKKSTIQNQQQFNKQFDLPFSAVLALITENIEYFIEQQIGFLKGVNETTNQQFIYLDKLYETIANVFDTNILHSQNQPSAIQACQLYNNLYFLSNSIEFYQKRIEYLQRIKPEQEFKSYQIIEKIKLKATDYIIDQMISKIDSLLENYKEVNYSPSYPNKECHYFIQDLIDYLIGAIQSIAMIRQDLVYSIIYPIFKRINEYIWEILVGKYMKQINICGIRNLELDLLSLFELCGTHFGKYNNLMECLREIRQFLDIFLVHQDPETLLDQHLKQNQENGFLELGTNSCDILQIKNKTTQFNTFVSQFNSLVYNNELKINQQKQWNLYIQENYWNQPSDWSKNEISNCGGIHMLGGYGLLADDQIEKQFTEIPSHQFVRIKANYHFIDSWSGETGYMKIGTKENNEYIWTQSYDYNKAMDSINVCGSQYGEGKLTEHIDVTFRHSEKDLFIAFGSTLNNDAFDNSYGISNLQIYLM